MGTTLGEDRGIEVLACEEMLILGQIRTRVGEELHSDWYLKYEDTDPFVASHEEVMDLLGSAPDYSCRGLMAGILLFRQQLAILTAPGEFVDPAGAEMQQIEDIRERFGEQDNPDWYQRYEDIDPCIATRAEVTTLLESAPDHFCRGLVAGIMLMRQQVAILTGREF